jgi:GntR family transcriptional regulator, transcriptional repressor for pyruvate dehydrogenase complex
MPELLSKAVADDLLGRVGRGEYQVGDRLPSEQSLMRRYGVGRNTVREAMHTLRTLGIVEVRPRLGAKVVAGGERSALANSAVSALLLRPTIMDLYDVRLILEPAAAARAALHRTDTDLAAIRRAHTHFRIAYEMGDPVWQADVDFHQAIADASGNGVLARVLSPMSDLLHRAREATGRIPAAVDLALDQHERIAAAIEAGESDRASAAMQTHIEAAITALGQAELD